MKSVLLTAMAIASMPLAQTTGKTDWGTLSGRMKNRKLNPEGYRGKPTKRRLKVKLARKAKLRNQRNG